MEANAGYTAVQTYQDTEGENGQVARRRGTNSDRKPTKYKNNKMAGVKKSEVAKSDIALRAGQ